MRTKRYSLVVILLCLPCSILAFPQRIARPVGESVLASVQYVAGRVAKSSSSDVQGLGGSSFVASEEDDKQVWTALANLERDSKLVSCLVCVIWYILPFGRFANSYIYMCACVTVQELDTVAGQRAQLSGLELVMLSACVLAAGSGPLLLGGHITEFLAPASAACE